jgi:hypothetical protein
MTADSEFVRIVSMSINYVSMSTNCVVMSRNCVHYVFPYCNYLYFTSVYCVN